MNLYSIRAANGHTVKETGSFASKVDAKKARDELNGGTTAELLKDDKKAQFFVTKGSDHINYKN